MRFRLGELFCGAGGLAWGAVHAGKTNPIQNEEGVFAIDHVWANDVDESACKTYALNIVKKQTPNDASIEALIADAAAWADAEAKAGKFKSVLCGSVEKLKGQIALLPPIDAFAFGFPCNDFSSVGERKGLEGDFGPLYTYGVEVLNHHKPRWFVAENVEGLLHRDKGDVYDQIKREMKQAGDGYVITEHLYRFEEYGVPQCRTRLVIVGVSKQDAIDGIVFRVPAPTTENTYRTASWAMQHEPINPDAAKPVSEILLNNTPKKISERVKMRLAHTKPGENAWNADIPKEYALNVKKAHLSMIYRRLIADEPAYTITGNGGGGTHGYHWEELRALTNRERARLQSFPDDFEFCGGEQSVRQQIGMAVPPLASKIIFEAILKSYARVEYDYVEATTNRKARNRQQMTLPMNSDDAPASAE